MTTDETLPGPMNDTTPDSPADGAIEEAAPREPIAFNIKPEVAALGVKNFDDLPLHPRLLEAIAKIGWKEPTPVQKLCLPFSLRGRDVAGFAQTGTGKTAVFLLTICNKLLAAESAETAAPQGEGRPPRALVLAPTRELAMQIEDDAQTMLEHVGLTSIAVFGGIDYEKQAKKLKDGVDLIVATPGRLKDYVQKKYVDLSQVQVFVCDECDRMFDMGFIEDVEFFLEKIPELAQRLVFSATTNPEVKELAFEYLETPEYISVNPEVITPERIEQHGLHCHATEKLKVLIGMLREHNPECAIIFTNTKLTAEWLHFKLTHNGIEADLITGDLPQNKRIRLIKTIKEGKLKLLIATDVASRGLHVSRITHVYNFDLPDEAANYVHRIGRTARAGAKGFAYSLVCDDYGQNLAPINALLGDASVQTEWPKEEYLKIQDNAGNPFEDRYKKPSFDRPREDRGPREDRARGGRPGAEGRDRGPRDQQARGGQAGGGRDRGGRGGRDQQHGRGHQNGGGRHQQGGQQHGGRNQQHGGQGRHGGRGRDQHRDRPVAAAQASRGPEEIEPKSFGQTIKRFFKTIFGMK